jgi:hypothetical protein
MMCLIEGECREQPMLLPAEPTRSWPSSTTSILIKCTTKVIGAPAKDSAQYSLHSLQEAVADPTRRSQATHLPSKGSFSYSSSAVSQ